MTTSRRTESRVSPDSAEPHHPPRAQHPMTKGQLVVSWVTSTDHKVIGYLYFITSFGFFLIGRA